MKKIWRDLSNHLQQDFHPLYYASCLSLLGIAIFFSYHTEFADTVLQTKQGYVKYLYYFLFYGIPYFVTIALYAHFKSRQIIFLSIEFWVKSLLGLSVLALDSSAPFLLPLVTQLFDPSTQFWASKVIINAMSIFTIIVPLVIFHAVYEKDTNDYYGLTPRHFNVRPYLVMLLIMLPVIIAISFHESFQRQYPMYKITLAHQHLGVDEWVTVAIYELAYGLDFITVEFLFRGFFVVGMASVLGRNSILPMSVIYCFLHFGKPMGEAISSIAGGYILGVVAYETRSIWGGVIVHMGIAWMMEIVSFLQKQL